MFGAFAYDQLVRANGIVNAARRWFRLDDCRFSTRVKILAKQAVQFISDFEQRLVCHAKELECDGVICGHIHVPRIEQIGNVTYCNTGDWVEHCTALVEDESGTLELIDWSRQSAKTMLRERQPVQRTIRPFQNGFRHEHIAASVQSALAAVNELPRTNGNVDLLSVIN
jgi:hypothetical protein